MKKVIVVLFVALFIASQGIAFAEDTDVDVQATAEDMIADDGMVVEDTMMVDDFMTPEGDEAIMFEETEEEVPADEM